ncbi:sugar transferase [Bacillaceae bacterium Marseille-Q3522]|nr:sugar transferase [Bacillaceae bacterium Marseille-Q3522]
MKRLFDVTIASLLLLMLFPLMMIIAVIVRSKLGAPVFFKQKRPGLHGNPFYLYKFRTMTNDKNESGELLTDEKRLTSFGKFLRSFSLDEWPQLWNVIKGDMSLVGPRPLLMEYLPLYNSEQTTRHFVKPGITGWAQINGRNAVGWEEKLQLDVWYVTNQSFLLDLKILFFTVKKVIRSEDINQPGMATITRFKGTHQTEKEVRP